MSILKKFISLILLIVILSLSINIEAYKVYAASKTNILFIGNSKTYYNGGVDQIFQGLANAKGKNVYVTREAHGGYSLLELSNKAHTKEYNMPSGERKQNKDIKSVINKKEWDYVVLQEQTTTALNDLDKFKAGATELSNLILNNSSETQIIYDAVWVYRSLNKTQQNKTNKNNETVRNTTGGIVSYTGNAFINCKKTYPGIELFVDVRHPTLAGTYLRACCVYATIYKESPVGIKYYGGLKQETAVKLQKIAASTMGLKTIAASIDREPRLKFIKTQKDKVTIFIHDNGGINISQTKLYMGSSNKGIAQPIKLIQSNNGVYTKKGTRIADEKNYSGAKYDYGFIINKSQLSTSYKNFYIETKDYSGKCYLNEHFQIKALQSANASNEYFQVNRSPRVTLGVSGNKLFLKLIDNSGVKNVTITTPTKNDNKYTKLMSYSGLTSSGAYIKSVNTTPFAINKIKDTKQSDGRYIIRVVSEDCSGNKSVKTMRFNII